MHWLKIPLSEIRPQEQSTRRQTASRAQSQLWAALLRAPGCAPSGLPWIRAGFATCSGRMWHWCGTGTSLVRAPTPSVWSLGSQLPSKFWLPDTTGTQVSPNKTPRLTTRTRNKALGKRPSPSSGEGRQPGPVSQPPNHKNKSLSEAIYPFKILKFVLDLMNYSK